jgi:hypothetical protein
MKKSLREEREPAARERARARPEVRMKLLRGAEATESDRF